MDPTLTIELMNEHNLASVFEIEQESFKDPWSLQSFRSELELNRMAIYLVARLDGRVVGYIGSWLVLDEGHITTLAVESDYRRCGIGGCLVRTLIKRVIPHGARRMTLEVRPSNRGARKFYSNLGFEVHGRRKSYYSDEDALIMTLHDLQLPEKNWAEIVKKNYEQGKIEQAEPVEQKGEGPDEGSTGFDPGN